MCKIFQTVKDKTQWRVEPVYKTHRKQQQIKEVQKSQQKTPPNSNNDYGKDAQLSRPHRNLNQELLYC